MRWLLAAVLVVVVLLHPMVDAGSDSDEALTIASRESLCGRNPYRCHTSLGNPLSPLPGWIVLNLPTAVVSAHLFPLLWVALWARCRSALAVCILALLAGKTLIQGIDYASNACCVVWACDLLAANVHPCRSVVTPDGSVWVARLVGLAGRAGDCLMAWLGRPSDESEVCQGDSGDYGLRCVCAAVLLALPPLWVSNAAYHGVMVLPFLLEGLGKDLFRK